jgi:hypothetical protein
MEDVLKASFEKVAEDDLAFRTEAAKEVMVPEAEAAALRTLFEKHCVSCEQKVCVS